MNKNLNDAIDSVRKADALMFVIESTYLDFDIEPEYAEKAGRGVYTFYALWDAIKAAEESLERLEGDRKVVDVIYAVNRVRQDGSTLKTSDKR